MARGRFTITIDVEGDEYEVADAARAMVERLESDEDATVFDWELVEP